MLATMRSWRHVNRVRAAARGAALGAESPGESLARELAVQAGLSGDIITQFPVKTDTGVAWCDILVGCHVIEFDGRVKYRPPTSGGFATDGPDEVVWKEKVRERDIASHGLAVSRVFWDDCLGPRRTAAIDRLARAHGEACRRFGTSLPADVAAFARQMDKARDARLRREFLAVDRYRSIPKSA